MRHSNLLSRAVRGCHEGDPAVGATELESVDEPDSITPGWGKWPARRPQCPWNSREARRTGSGCPLPLRRPNERETPLPGYLDAIREDRRHQQRTDETECHQNECLVGR